VTTTLQADSLGSVTDFKVADLSLAAFGRKEIQLAEHEMPGLMALRTEFGKAKPFAGKRIIGSLQRGISSPNQLAQELGVLGERLGELRLHAALGRELISLLLQLVCCGVEPAHFISKLTRERGTYSKPQNSKVTHIYWLSNKSLNGSDFSLILISRRW